jgi:S1-C subfamily serine protease
MKYFRQVIMAILAMSFMSPVGLGAAGSDARNSSMGFRDAVKKVKPAVVYIESTMKVNEGFRYGYGQASGSGVIIDAKKGYVLTAAHVVDEAKVVTVRLEDGRKFTAKNVWGDAESDVGLVQIEAENLPEATLGDSDKLEVGDWVLAIGSPFGRVLENSVSAGIVSAKGRRTGVLGQMGVEDFIQTDAVINKGNSGGPLVNIDGEVVGINSNIISSTGMNAGLGFAVPSKMAKAALEQLTKGGKVVRGYMGVSLADFGEIDPAEAGKIPEAIKKRGGVYVGEVVAGGPADEAGVKAGDVIFSLDGKNITSASELIEYVRAKMPGDEVKCHVWRNGKELALIAKLVERPGSEEAGTVAMKIGVGGSDYAGVAISAKGMSRIRGIVVEYVKAGSPADRAGIEMGDVIAEVDGKPSPNNRALERLLRAGNLKKGISLTIINDSGERTVVVRK